MTDSARAQPNSSLRVDELAKLVREQAEAIKALKSQISTQITREIANTTHQLEAHQALQALIGDLPAPLHGWPISPDFGLQLVRLIRDKRYDLIVEFGSGASTFLCLRAFEQFGLHSSSQDASQHRLITFEHLDVFRQKTIDLVATCSNLRLLDLRLSPLEPWADFSGSYSYYAGSAAIPEAVQAIATFVDQPLRLLVIIDGPPAESGHWARYPAVPIILDAASSMDLSIDFLLDDMIRTDEKEIALAWEHLFQAFALPYQRVDYDFEKGCLLLSVKSLSGIDTSLSRGEVLLAEKRSMEAGAAAIARVDELLAELDAARQNAAQEKAEVEQNAAQLMQQLAAQDAELQQAHRSRDEQAALAAGLEEQLAQLKVELQLMTAAKETVVQEMCEARESAAAQARQFAAQVDALQQAQQSRDELVAQIQALRCQLAQQTEELQHNQERLQAIPHLQRELQESRQQGAHLRRQLEILSVECGRRYQALQRCEQQDFEIRQLQSRSADLEAQLHQSQRDAQQQADAHSAQIFALEAQLDAARQAAQEQQNEASSAERILRLEQELKEARDEAELLLEQLHLVQEELEHYFLLSQGQDQGQGQQEVSSPPVLSATRQEVTAAINSNRGRLLSAV